MEDFCPTILQIFYGLFTNKPSQAVFNSAMRLGICIAANVQSRLYNGFQKQLGVILYKHGAPIKVNVNMKSVITVIVNNNRIYGY